jgi:hypothetical protein
MKKLTPHMPLWAAAAICAAVVVIAVGAGRNRTSRQAILSPDRNAFLFSATEIVLLPGGNPQTDSDIARLDPTTGAVYRLRGNLDNPSVRNTWELRVPPVKGPHSGLLEVQQARLPGSRNGRGASATFLVDIVSGRTWILRPRASSNASWDPVEIFR